MAKIIITRKKSGIGSVQSHDVFLVNQYIGELKNGGTIEVPVDVGTYLLTFNSKKSFGQNATFTCVVNYPNEIVEVQTKVSFNGDYVVEYADNAPHIPITNTQQTNSQNANQPVYNQAPIIHPKKKSNKTLIVMLVVLAVLLVMCFVGIFGLILSDDTSTTSNNSSSTNTVTTLNVGETLNANGLKITYTKVEDWQSDNMFITAKDGYKFIRVYFIMENTNNRDYTMGGFDFQCYADNSKMDYSIYGDDQIDLFSTVSAGRKLEGYIYYEVPTNAQSIEIEYETSFWSDEKAIFKVK